MRVQSVNLINLPKRQKNASALQGPGLRYTTAPLNNSYPNDVIGRSLVSFGRSRVDFKETMGYFKLGKDEYGNNRQPIDYQVESAKPIHAGLNVLVCAPTGTGKTAIAYYTISKNLAEGKRTFYTAPLKALSNQKIRELQERFGAENVGILTGDIKINPNAKILVMTTEIYTNMLIGERLKGNKGSERNGIFADVGSVVYDEMHYLNDTERGKVWEMAMILTPKHIQQVSLSATVGNPDQVIKWQNYSPARIGAQETVLVNVPSSKRKVPLRDLYMPVSKSQNRNIPSDESFFGMVQHLKSKDRVPAIFFVPSKSDNRYLVNLFGKESLDPSLVLTNKSEQSQIEKIIKEHPSLRNSVNIEALKRGYAMHNAGMLPETKELIEQLFQKKLVKVVFSTETLAAGINMPAKAVIITSHQKPTSKREANPPGGHKREYTSSEIKQMGGRAGRWGIDDEGFVYFMCQDNVQKGKFKTLYKSTAAPLESKLNFDYSFIAGCKKSDAGKELLDDAIASSLGNFTGDKNAAAAHKSKLKEEIKEKAQILIDDDFIDSKGKLTIKGKLLSQINGYEQLPVLNIIHDGLLTGMSPSELAACVGMMANASEKVKDNIERDEKKGFDLECDLKEIMDKDPDGFLTSALDSVKTKFDEYNRNMFLYGDFYEVGVDSRTANHLLTWAELNRKNPVPALFDKGAESRNWQDFFQKFHDTNGVQRAVDTSGLTRRQKRKLNNGDKLPAYLRGPERKSVSYEEGHLFREIAQTIDLLKQVDKICQHAVSLGEVADKHYYESLRATAREAIKLLSRGPCMHV